VHAQPLDEPLQAHVKGRGDVQCQKLREQKPGRDRDPEGLACLVVLLEKKGWVLQRTQGSHHVYVKEGNPARISVPIHGNRPLKVGLQRHLVKLAATDEK
jgi:predicted RNA binding protein YcfA (HicA-like mRNA interferase family)